MQVQQKNTDFLKVSQRSRQFNRDTRISCGVAKDNQTAGSSSLTTRLPKKNCARIRCIFDHFSCRYEYDNDSRHVPALRVPRGETPVTTTPPPPCFP